MSRTHQEDAKGRGDIAPPHSWSRYKIGVSGQRHALAALYPRYPLNRRLGWPESWYVPYLIPSYDLIINLQLQSSWYVRWSELGIHSSFRSGILKLLSNGVTFFFPYQLASRWVIMHYNLLKSSANLLKTVWLTTAKSSTYLSVILFKKVIFYI
jgi:hypothetical protein